MNKTLMALFIGLSLLPIPAQAQKTEQEKLYIQTVLNVLKEQGYTLDSPSSQDKWLMLDKGKGYCRYLKSNYPYATLIDQIKIDTNPKLYLRGTEQDKINWSITMQGYYETVLYASTVVLCPEQEHKAIEYYQKLEQSN
ncbi:MAG: hypothetical protein RMZ69_15970 [Nostoc sp. ChiQUE01a]|nr:hypothetical protein [Nostoc sp. ChiQUE01a]